MTTHYHTRPSHVQAGAADFASLLACSENYVASQPVQQAASRPPKAATGTYSRLPAARAAKPTRHESTYSTSA